MTTSTGNTRSGVVTALGVLAIAVGLVATASGWSAGIALLVVGLIAVIWTVIRSPRPSKPDASTEHADSRSGYRGGTDGGGFGGDGGGGF